MHTWTPRTRHCMDMDSSYMRCNGPHLTQGQFESARLSLGALRPNAVCLSGGYRSFESTVGALRELVLEPWRADAYAVMSTSRDDGALIQRRRRTCEARLNLERSVLPHCLVGTQGTISRSSGELSRIAALLELPAARQVFSRSSKGNGVGSVEVRLLMTAACHRKVGVHEEARGLAYAAYAHIRPDLMFYTPLPIAYRLPYGHMDVRVPPGDDWGRPRGLNPDILFGGAGGFRASSDAWKLLEAPEKESALFIDGWVSEQLWRRGVQKRGGANVTRPFLAYCKVNQLAECRYFGQLARNVREVPGFLTTHPATSGLLCRAAAGPCHPLSWPVQLPTADNRSAVFCDRFCSARGHCGMSRSYRSGGTDCTGCTAEEAASEPSARCPAACRRCRAGGSHDGGVMLGLGAKPWSSSCSKPFCRRFCSSQGHCGMSRSYRSGGTNCTGCTAEEAASEPSVRCPAACRRCHAGAHRDGGVALVAGHALCTAVATARLYTHAEYSNVPQTDEDMDLDPGWCDLIGRVDRAVVGGSRGRRLCARWGGEDALAHR